MKEYMKKQPVITAIQFNEDEYSQTLDFLSKMGISYSFSISGEYMFYQTILKIGPKTYDEDGNEILKNVNDTDYIVVETHLDGKLEVNVLNEHKFHRFYESKE